MLGKCKMTGKEKELPCSAAGCPLFGDCIVDYEKAIKKPQTNADRIRAMSDEELAKVPSQFGYSCVFPQKECGESDTCEKCLLKWLKQPAGKDNDE